MSESPTTQGGMPERERRLTVLMPLAIAALVGVAAASGAFVFRMLVSWMELLFWGVESPTGAMIRELPWWMKLLVPALGGLILAPIVFRWAPDAKGSGIPEVIETVALRGGVFRRRVAPLKALAASICIGSGGSVGREGPIVHIGAALGSWVARYARGTVQQTRTYVGCGVAAGIAATFNTPFAGALFAIEVVLGDRAGARIPPIVIASIVATAISRTYFGHYPHITVPDFEISLTLATLLPFMAMGVFVGLVGAFFVEVMRHAYALADRWRLSIYLLPVAGGLLVGVIGLEFPEVFGVGYDTLNRTLAGEISVGVLVCLVVAKVVATSLTLASGGAGGSFAPSLLIGALAGALFAEVIMGTLTRLGLEIPHGLNPTSFGLAGMGAMVAATSRAPITAVLFVFEMTFEPEVISPLLAACIPALIMSSMIHGESMYISRLLWKGVRLPEAGTVNLLKGMRVAEVLCSRVERLAPQTPLQELLDRFLRSPYPVVWLVDDKGRLAGTVESRNIQIAMLEKDALGGLVLAEDLATPPRRTLHPEDDLSFAMKNFAESDIDVVPVVDRDTLQLLGDLHRADVIAAYNRELEQRDTINTTGDAIEAAGRLGRVDLGGGYSLMEYEVPVHLAGQTLKELNLRARFGVQVILLKRGAMREVPGPDTKLVAADVLLLAGRGVDLVRMEREA